MERPDQVYLNITLLDLPLKKLTLASPQSDCTLKERYKRSRGINTYHRQHFSLKHQHWIVRSATGADTPTSPKYSVRTHV